MAGHFSPDCATGEQIVKDTHGAGYFFFHGYGPAPRWRMCLRIFTLMLLVFIAQACLTMRNSKAIEEYRSPINEFDRPLPGGANYRILPGHMVVQNGRKLLQFDSVLIGEKRFLNVESSAAGMRFYESAQRLDQGKKVFLIQQNACCMDDAAFRRILFLKPGEKTTAAEILKTYYGLESGATTYPDALLVMDFTNIYTFRAMHGYWQSEAGLSYLVQAPSTDYNEVMREIEWRQRSRISLAAMYGWYAVTVPVDIVTSPFQLIGMYLLGKGMVH